MTKENTRVDGPHVKGYGKIEPYTWKAIAAMAATSLAQIAADVRRIADAKAGRRYEP